VGERLKERVRKRVRKGVRKEVDDGGWSDTRAKAAAAVVAA
jgi:hypothetical protein